MALARCNFAVTDTAGNVVDGASVEVRRETPGLPLVQLYSDRDGATPIGNPFTAADGGDAGFHVAGGAYKITATLGAFTRTWRYVSNGLGGESDEGADGVNAGFIQAFDSSTSDADPGAGEFRLNHATPTSATAIYLDNNNEAGVAVSGVIDLWDDSTNMVKGSIKIEKIGDPAIYYQWNVTGSVVDGTGYRKVTITGGVGAGTLAAADRFSITFLRAGNAGAAGFVQAFDSSTSDADPGAGEFRLNHATPTSATAVYLDNVSTYGVTVSGIIDKWDDSTNTIRGTLKIEKLGDPSIYYEWNVTGSVVDGTGYRKLTIASGAGAGTLTAADQFAIMFTRAGDAGAASGSDLISTGNAYVQIDSDNNTTNAEFQVRKDSATPGGGTFLFGVDEAGLITTLGQIKFPASMNASADANTFDDYEEGTWTPVITFVTPGDLSLTYSTQVGTYTKIGDCVRVSFYARTSSFTHTTASGQLRVTGLPFTIKNVTGNIFISTMQYGGITKASYTVVLAQGSANQALVGIVASGSGVASATVDAADTPTGGTLDLRSSTVYLSA